MAISRSQQLLLQRLKMRGPQSVKILAKQLDMTTMGARQHLSGLRESGYVTQSREARQNRGRPVHFWQLTRKGHQYFPDGHAQVALELVDVVRAEYGDEGLDRLLQQRSDTLETAYRAALAASPPDLQARIDRLAAIRSDEGYMAETRLLPDGWLLIENHCPIVAAAERCQQFCGTELGLFRRLFAQDAQVERVDHLLAGARRCAYKITPLPAA